MMQLLFLELCANLTIDDMESVTKSDCDDAIHFSKILELHSNVSGLGCSKAASALSIMCIILKNL